MVNNLDWTGPQSALDFLRDVGKHFWVNVMLARETVKRRLAADGHVVHRVQLPAPAGPGLPGPLPPARMHAADRRRDQWGNLSAGST